MSTVCTLNGYSRCPSEVSVIFVAFHVGPPFDTSNRSADLHLGSTHRPDTSHTLTLVGCGRLTECLTCRYHLTFPGFSCRFLVTAKSTCRPEPNHSCVSSLHRATFLSYGGHTYRLARSGGGPCSVCWHGIREGQHTLERQ